MRHARDLMTSARNEQREILQRAHEAAEEAGQEDRRDAGGSTDDCLRHGSSWRSSTSGLSPAWPRYSFVRCSTPSRSKSTGSARFPSWIAIVATGSNSRAAHSRTNRGPPVRLARARLAGDRASTSRSGAARVARQSRSLTTPRQATSIERVSCWRSPVPYYAPRTDQPIDDASICQVWILFTASGGQMPVSRYWRKFIAVGPICRSGSRDLARCRGSHRGDHGDLLSSDVFCPPGTGTQPVQPGQPGTGGPAASAGRLHRRVCDLAALRDRPGLVGPAGPCREQARFLGITTDQYPIVHEHLFGAIVEVSVTRSPRRLLRRGTRSTGTWRTR